MECVALSQYIIEESCAGCTKKSKTSTTRQFSEMTEQRGNGYYAAGKAKIKTASRQGAKTPRETNPSISGSLCAFAALRAMPLRPYKPFTIR